MKTTLFLLLLTVSLAVPAGAQIAPLLPYGAPPEAANIVVSWAGDEGQTVVYDAVDLVAVEPFEKGKPVTGAPYMADAVTEVTQSLSDGNRIERRTSAKIARDGHGRMRREQQSMAVGTLVAEAEATIITISDPVAGTFVTLDTERRTAMQSKMPTPARRAARTRSLEVVGGEKGGDKWVMSNRMEGVQGTAGVRVSPPYTPADPARVPAVSVKTDSLGTQIIEGVRAEGQRTTTTIPQGAIGNQQPIEVVSERWFSPELQVVVLTRRTDPRFGETVYRLTNIQRAEPAPALFQIPSDYRIEEPQWRPYIKPKP